MAGRTGTIRLLPAGVEGAGIRRPPRLIGAGLLAIGVPGTHLGAADLVSLGAAGAGLGAGATGAGAGVCATGAGAGLGAGAAGAGTGVAAPTLGAATAAGLVIGDAIGRGGVGAGRGAAATGGAVVGAGIGAGAAATSCCMFGLGIKPNEPSGLLPIRPPFCPVTGSVFIARA